MEQNERINRILDEANFMIETKHTVRTTSKFFGVSKSTIFNDVAKVLPTIDKNLAKEVKKVLLYNKMQRYSRGGKSTTAKK